MAFCSKCGAQLADGVKFCGTCGAKVEQTSQSSSQRKTTFDGEIHKCPNCGEILKAFETVCPSCGYEIRGTGASKVVTDFNEKLEQAKGESQKITVILTYPIPNTKEDIYELFLLAYSNLDTNLYVQKLDYEDISDAWYSLIKRCYEKAKLSFGNHIDFTYLEKKFAQLNAKLDKDINKLHKKEKLQKNKGLIIALSVLLLLAVVAVILVSVLNRPIEIGCTESELVGKSYSYVKSYLESKGFENIEAEIVYVYDSASVDSLVLDVKIDGKDGYTIEDRFDKETLITIIYQVKQKITIGKKATDFSVAEGFWGSGATIYMSYDEAVIYLESLGFTNFAEPTEYYQTGGDGLKNVPDGSVYKITINGIDDFESTYGFYSDALIEIVIFRNVSN